MKNRANVVRANQDQVRLFVHDGVGRKSVRVGGPNTLVAGTFQTQFPIPQWKWGCAAIEQFYKVALSTPVRGQWQRIIGSQQFVNDRRRNGWSLNRSGGWQSWLRAPAAE